MDPIFELNGLWYFYDETWANTHGPFSSYEEADKVLKEYINYLEGISYGYS